MTEKKSCISNQHLRNNDLVISYQICTQIHKHTPVSLHVLFTFCNIFLRLQKAKQPHHALQKSSQIKSLPKEEKMYSCQILSAQPLECLLASVIYICLKHQAVLCISIKKITKIAYHINLKVKVYRNSLMITVYLLKCYLAHFITYFAQ